MSSASGFSSIDRSVVENDHFDYRRSDLLCDSKNARKSLGIMSHGIEMRLACYVYYVRDKVSLKAPITRKYKISSNNFCN